MTADKYSPQWLLNKLKESKTDTHKLMHIIDYQNEIAKQTKQLILSGVIVTLTCDRCGSEDLKDNGYFYTCNKCLNIENHKQAN